MGGDRIDAGEMGWMIEKLSREIDFFLSAASKQEVKAAASMLLAKLDAAAGGLPTPEGPVRVECVCPHRIKPITPTWP